MALLGIVQKFSATHGTKLVRTHEFKVEVTLEGKIRDGFVHGMDYIAPKTHLSNVLVSLEGQYLDDIVGRATVENIALYILFKMRPIPVGSLTIREGEEHFVTVFRDEMNFEDYPAMLHFNKGLSLLLREQPESASMELDHAIALNKDHAEAYNLRGRCKKYIGRYYPALIDFLKAIDINPEFGEAHRNLGNAYLYLGRLDEMMSEFDRAVELMPGSALAFNNRGYAYQVLKQWGLALADHSKAISLDPCYAEAYSDRAKTYESLGQIELAKGDLARAKELMESGKDTFAGIKMYG